MKTIVSSFLFVMALVFFAPRAEANGSNNCRNYPCGCCCSKDTTPCCDPQGAPRFVRGDAVEIAIDVAQQRQRVWKPAETDAFIGHYVRHASQYSVAAPTYTSAF